MEIIRPGVELLKRVIKEEIRSTPGKVDLLGGALYVFLVLIIVTEVIVVGAGRFLLRIFGREVAAPEFGGGEALLLIFGVPLYFLISVWMTRPAARRRG